jgi:hypothetical protein
MIKSGASECSSLRMVVLGDPANGVVDLHLAQDDVELLADWDLFSQTFRTEPLLHTLMSVFNS